ncbi:hypothetical protein LZ31DRAFT_270657 [Colletotrichum somersetense]|nr:hypothetical protein LZ31DRAFT_270657 [Colletotrichum somersetense]
MARIVRVFSMRAFDGEFFKYMPGPGETSARLKHLARFHLESHSNLEEDPAAPLPTIADMSLLLRLAPNLEAFESSPAPLGHGDVDWSGITMLSLACTNTDDVVKIVRSSCGLKEFAFSPNDSNDLLDKIPSALSMHASTLRRLDMHMWSAPVAMFTSLRELSIDTNYMGRREDSILRELPLSPKPLKTNSYPRECCKEIEWLAFQVGIGCYPNLEEIWLPARECYRDHPGPCGGANVDEFGFYEAPAHETDGRAVDDVEPGCDGGETVHYCQALFHEVGVSCIIPDEDTDGDTDEDSDEDVDKVTDGDY